MGEMRQIDNNCMNSVTRKSAVCKGPFTHAIFVALLYSYFEKGCRKKHKSARDNPER